MKYIIVLCLSSFFLFGFLFAVANVNAQTVGYRQTNLASDLPNMAHTVTPNLVNPWGIGFLPGQPFFIADNQVGRVTVHDIWSNFTHGDRLSHGSMSCKKMMIEMLRHRTWIEAQVLYCFLKCRFYARAKQFFFIQLVVFARKIPISQVGANSLPAGIEAFLIPPAWRRSPE